MPENWLIFVDTNIYLDFYRQSGESAKRQMEALERHKDRLIVSEQIRMEFLKNRQKVILKAFEDIKKPQKTSFPQILTDSQPAKMLKKSEIESEKRYKQLKTRVDNLLGQPAKYDDVFKVFNRIFKTNSDYNLKRPNKQRFAVRSRARKRFALGYPPRKASDTSIGDAYNWEWIVECALTSPPNMHILIVSRDGDYGASFSGKSFLSDWLHREFKDRVSSMRKIELTTKLTDALKRLDEVVTKEDEEAEEKLIGSEFSVSFDDIEEFMKRKVSSRLFAKDETLEAYLARIFEANDDPTK
jgi:hypothetical protein